ncbi:phosphoheptose isomerase [bacterium]|nr:MAG: phosphoheptose isomerase [bacterium]
MRDLEKRIGDSIDDSLKAVESLREQTETLIAITELAVSVINDGKTIYFIGNGGSAADAQHAAAELVGRLGMGLERKPLPAVALTTDTSVITALANDYGFDDIFSRQLSAVGKSGDLLVAISTSGKSTNIIKAAEIARGKQMYTVALTGACESPLSKFACYTIKVDGPNTPRIQEGHRTALHIICELIEISLVE